VDRAIPLVERSKGIRGRPEFAPPGIRHALAEPDVAGNCVATSPGDFSGETEHDLKAAQSGGAPACVGDFLQMADLQEHKVFMGNADHAGYLILHLRSYPAWRVTVNGRATAAAREEGYGLMAVPIPQGQSTVAVDWTTTSDVWVGQGISALGLALIAGLFAAERRFSRPRSS
jgi:hypothetical protein